MKYFNLLLAGLAVTLASSCAKDDVDSNNSIFDTSEVVRNDFDKWLKKNYTDSFNIEFNYLYNDKLTNNTYNVIPAKVSNSIAMAKLLKHVWMDAYTEVAGKEFLKNHCFRQIQLIGSGEYKSTGEMTLGTAEGGLKVLLYRINELDLDSIYINHDDPYRPHSSVPLDLNYWYFHTMHHEFCHILTQTKNYSTDFQQITASKYHAGDWVNVGDKDAPKEGFVTGYGSSEYNEDFAEIYATYVTNTEEAWQKILANGIDTLKDENGNVQYLKDADGNDVYETDEDGDYIPERDEYGFLVPEVDADGNIVYLTNSKGYNYYYMMDASTEPYSFKVMTMADTTGTNFRPIRMYKGQTEYLFYDLDCPYWYYSAAQRFYPAYMKANNDTPLYQVYENHYVYDKFGNPVPQYYKFPAFKLKRKVVADESGKAAILAKLEIIRAYMKDSWGIDLDELREAVLRRSEEAVNLDLRNLD